MHPFSLDLTGRLVRVFGAGPVAERKIATLLTAEAQIDVISPEATPEIQRLATAGKLTWQQRLATVADLDQCWLAVIATSDQGVNTELIKEADRRQIFTLHVEGSAHSSAVVTGSAAAAGITIGINADRDPGRAIAVRNWLAGLLHRHELPIQRTRNAKDSYTGSVALIGGGPGASDLITVRGLNFLHRADVVITDRLAPNELLDHLSPETLIVDVGKRRGYHAHTQSEINALIIAHAREGKFVVRLKGGDPFLLGRGGEEVQACLSAGIAVHVVPGVSSALAVPAAAGIPLTHRGIADSVLIISGHTGALDIANTAKQVTSDTTLVILMGVATIGQICTELLRTRSADTAVCMIEKGWSPHQRTLVATLDTAGQVAIAQQLQAPAVIVVGQTAEFANQFGDLR